MFTCSVAQLPALYTVTALFISEMHTPRPVDMLSGHMQYLHSCSMHGLLYCRQQTLYYKPATCQIGSLPGMLASVVPLHGHHISSHKSQKLCTVSHCHHCKVLTSANYWSGKASKRWHHVIQSDRVAQKQNRYSLHKSCQAPLNYDCMVAACICPFPCNYKSVFRLQRTQ